MITSPAPHVLDTIMIMWTWRGRGRGLGGWRRGEEVNRLRSGKHAREISPCYQRSSGCPHPLSFPLSFGSPREGIRVRLSFERGNPDRMRWLMCCSSWLAGHGCQLASGQHGTPLDQVVRSPFSYSTYFFTSSRYFIKLLPYPISRHVITFVNLPRALSLCALT